MKISHIKDHDKDNFPPIPYLEQIALNNPESLTTYIRLWRLKDKEYKVTLKRKEVFLYMICLVQKFEGDVMRLCAQGLLSYTYKNRVYHLELVGWDNGELGQD
jgi:hypothetical protein